MNFDLRFIRDEWPMAVLGFVTPLSTFSLC